MLSVVVPIHDAQDYLDECLESLLAQDVADCEFLLVDDGSTDGSLETMTGFAALDERVVPIRQHWAGQGSARNHGVSRARGRYLAFVDADDTVPPMAHATMVHTLEATGSDLVIGAMAKQMHNVLHVPPWLAGVHRQRRLQVTLGEAPELITNIFPWNKVIRRSFWEGHQLRFPEGVDYEDHPALARALLLARSIDILPDVVYHWRQREQGTSVTRRKHELANLADFLTAKRQVTDLVVELGPTGVRQQWSVKLFNDFLPYIDQVPGASQRYWQLLGQGIRQFVDLVPVDAYARVAARTRLLCWLVAHDRRAQTETVHASLASGADPPVVHVDGVACFELPFLGAIDADVPTWLYRLAPMDRRLRAELLDVTWLGSSLRLTGRAHVTGVPGTDVPSVSGVLRERHSARLLRLPCPHWVDGAERVTFDMVIDWRALVDPRDDEPGRTTSSWGVEVVLDTSAGSVEGPWSGRPPGSLGRWSPSSRHRETIATLQWTSGAGLELVLQSESGAAEHSDSLSRRG